MNNQAAVEKVGLKERLLWLGGIVLFGLLYYSAARSSLLLAFGHSNATPVWPPAGIALAGLLLLGRRAWPAISVGAFAANAVVFFTNHATGQAMILWVSAVIACGNTLEALAGWLLFNHWMQRIKGAKSEGWRGPLFEKVYVFQFALVALAMCLVSAAFGPLAICASGIEPWQKFGLIWLTWWSGAATGVLLLTPFLLAWSGGARLQREPLFWIETILAFVLLGVICWAIFGSTARTGGYFAVAPLVWIAVRLGPRATATALLLLSATVVWQTLQGFGPFVRPVQNELLLNAIGYVWTMAVVSLALESSVSARREAETSLRGLTARLERRVEERTAELRENQGRFDAFMRNLPGVAFMKDREGRYVLMSQKAEAMLGRKAGDWIGKTDDEIWSEERAGQLRENDRRVLETGEPLQFMETTDHEDGLHYWLVNKFPILDNAGHPEVVAGIAVEITARKRAEQAKEESEQRFRALTETTSDAIISADEEGMIIGWNKGARLMFGRDEEEVLDQPLTLLMPDRYREAHLLGLERFNATGEAHVIGRTVEMYGLRKNGEEFPIELALSSWEASGRRFFSAILRDITHHKQAGDDLKRTVAELARSNAELEQFAYVASHDLQEPLRAVTGCVEILEKDYRGKLDSGADELMKHSVEGARRMQTLIHDLLAYSRVGSRGRPFEATDCNAALNKAIVNLGSAIRESGAVITRDPLPTLNGDPTQLPLLFQNLVGNAIKFCVGRCPKIHVGVQETEEGWRFSVSDNGIGIDSQYRDRIFVIFQRLHTRTEYPGTGIGLAICRRIVERHGGQISVESEPGKGSTFYFTILKQENNS